MKLLRLQVKTRNSSESKFQEPTVEFYTKEQCVQMKDVMISNVTPVSKKLPHQLVRVLVRLTYVRTLTNALKMYVLQMQIV